MKKDHVIAVLVITVITSLSIYGCGGGSHQASGTDSATNTASTSAGAASASSDPKGVGKFKDVQLTHPLDQSMVSQGKAIYEVMQHYLLSSIQMIRW